LAEHDHLLLFSLPLTPAIHKNCLIFSFDECGKWDDATVARENGGEGQACGSVHTVIYIYTEPTIFCAVAEQDMNM
jgi:hypothetical protein